MIDIILNNLIPFIIILTILVFVHELGHYLIARRNGVKVEVFSIGFGKELFGFTDKNETRWKFSLIPLGGYVKMDGDLDEASTKKKESSEIIAGQSFHEKTIYQRSMILVAGPAANFIFSFLLLIFINGTTFSFFLTIFNFFVSDTNAAATNIGLNELSLFS